MISNPLSLKKFSSQNLFLFLLLFFWMFSPVINFFSFFEVKTYIFFIILPAILGFMNYFFRSGASQISNNVLAFILISFLYLGILEYVGLLNGIIDYSFTKDVLMGLLLFFSAYFIVNKYHMIYGHGFIDSITRHLFFFGLIHGLLILLVAFSYEFNEFLYQFISLSDKQEKSNFGEVAVRRYSGLLPTGFSTLSVTHALLLVLGIFNLWVYKQKQTLTNILIYASSFFILFISILYIGRSGLILILSYLLFFFLYWVYVTIRTSKTSVKVIKYIGVSFSAGVLFSWAIDFEDYKDVIEASFEFAIRYAETGTLGTGSTDTVINSMLIFPSDAITLIFGNGNFGRGSNLISSDLGFVYFVNGAGIFGTIIAFSFYFVLTYHAFKLRRLNYLLFLVFIIFILFLIPLNFKDLYFLAFNGYAKVFFIFLFIYHFIYKEKKSKQKILS